MEIFNYFGKKASLQMLDWVVNTPLCYKFFETVLDLE